MPGANSMPNLPAGYAAFVFKPAHAGEIAPLKDSWPPADLATITAKARERARRWSQDAELVEINLQVQPWSDKSYVQTDDGTATLRFDFYSPSKQEGISITPNAPGSAAQPDTDVYNMGFVDWGDKLPIPDNFLSISSVIRKAQQKGTRSPTIKSASLSNNPQGTSTGDQDLSGLKWELEPVFGRRYVINAKVADNVSAGSG
jgi:hypothetical protein